MLNIPEHTKCKNCGFCCCIVPITPSEDLSIRRHLAKIDGAILDRLVNQPRSYDECQFHDQEKRRCAIYPVRPRICRLFGAVLGMNCPHGNTTSLNIRHFPVGQPVMLMPEYIASTRSNDYSVPLAKLSHAQEHFKQTSCLLAAAEVEHKYRYFTDLFQC